LFDWHVYVDREERRDEKSSNDNELRGKHVSVLDSRTDPLCSVESQNV
jgi:hypothetical protein